MPTFTKCNNDAKLGFFRIGVNIPDCKYIPLFPFRVKSNIIFPSGKFETYVTLAELQACKDDSLYRILEGCQFIPESDIYPYRDFVEKLYQKRLELKQQNNPYYRKLYRVFCTCEGAFPFLEIVSNLLGKF